MRITLHVSHLRNRCAGLHLECSLYNLNVQECDARADATANLRLGQKRFLLSRIFAVMQLPSSLLENAVNEFTKLPGIGKKTALRMVLHLLKQDAAVVENFSETIAKMRRDIKFCQRCHNISDGDICAICSNSMRNQHMICVVENLRDVIAIEGTQQFNGTYHVLGGIISPLDGIGPDQLNIESLVGRIEKEQIEELVFALSPNIQGDTTIY